MDPKRRQMPSLSAAEPLTGAGEADTRELGCQRCKRPILTRYTIHYTAESIAEAYEARMCSTCFSALVGQDAARALNRFAHQFLLWKLEQGPLDL